MKLSTKTRYGVRALVDMACQSGQGHISLSSIAQRQDLSPKYLEQEFATLRRAGILKSVKGAQGGYMLARPPSEIRVDEVIRVLEGDLAIVDRLESDVNNPVRAFLYREVYEPVGRAIEARMSCLSLMDLVRQYEEEQLSRNMFYI